MMLSEREQHAALRLYSVFGGSSCREVHPQVNMEETSYMQGPCDGRAAGSVAARHGTALMNKAWGHLPPLNYRSVEA